MGYYIGLSNYRPSARSDGRKWTTVGIYEAPSVGGQPGAWAEIDAQAIPDYPDATAPPVMAFSTTNATAASGLWYKVQFRDSFSGIQDGVPEYSGIFGVPDVEWVRATSNVDFDELGYPAPGAGDVDRLQPVLDEAEVQFQAVTGIDPRDVAEATRWLPMVRMAIRMLVEYATASSQMEQLETASDYDMLSSMSVSGYSESRRGLIRPNPDVLHPWPALNRLLNLVIYFDEQGNAGETGPSVVGPPLRPAPYEAVMREHDLAARQRALRPGGVGPVVGPVWPGGGC